MNKIPQIISCLNKEGIVILSGFYAFDLKKVNNRICSFGLSLINKFKNNDWQCLVYQNVR